MTARLLKESEGDIFFLGKRINGGKRLCAAGKEMQMVFQNPADSFNPHYSVLECVMQGARYYKLYSKSELKERAMEMDKICGIKRILSGKEDRGVKRRRVPEDSHCQSFDLQSGPDHL